MSAAHTPEIVDLVAVYGLGGVDATTGECAAIRAHIAQCPMCQSEFRRSAAVAAAIGKSAAQPAPAWLRAKVLAALPVREVPLAAQHSAWYIPAAIAAAAVIIAGVWWNAARQAGQTWAATCTSAIVNCHASGVLTASRSVLTLHVRGLDQLPTGKQYQAWVIVPGTAPKPEPVFSANRDGNGSVVISQAPVKGVVIAVTVEPAGGSFAPTTKPILTATIQ